jgi:tetratricopeptide (TPR) repeat protein
MKHTWKCPTIGVVAIILLTLVAYIPAMRGGFVFDDHILVTGSPIVKASDGLHRFWLTTEAPEYLPLTSTLWWLEWRLWHDNAVGYHVVNVLLHAVNAVLVWVILRRLKIPGAWLTGLVFALHPVNVATVAWISEQKSTLSMLFGSAAILLYLRFDEEDHWRWYGLSLAAYLLALLSKTAIIMLPVALLGCLWWLHGKVRQKDVLRSMPFFVLSLVLGLVTIWFQYHRGMGGHANRVDGFFSHLAAAGCVPWFYLYKVYLPIGLTVIYPKWEINASRWVSYAPGVILMGWLTLFWWKRNTWGRPWLFGLGYFVAMLFPVLGFFDQSFHRYSLVADHWGYCAIIGVIALAVAIGERICRRIGEPGQSVGVVASVVVLLVLGVGTWRRSCVYATDETLWRDNVAKNPKAWVAHNNLGLALTQSGRFTEDIGQYEQAVRINPDYAEAHNNLGNALLRLGRTQEAIRHWEQALRNRPDYAEAYYNLGAALHQMGKVEEAIGEYKQAVRIKPDYAEAHNNLGIALTQSGRVSEGIGQYEQALQINPDYAEAHNNLGVALKQNGSLQDAIGQYEQALRINADYAAAYNNLAWLLATLTPTEGGDPVRAVSLAQRACELTVNREPVYLNTLATAYAAAGRFNDAMASARKAIELLRSAGQPQLAKEIEDRLERYHAGLADR